MLAGGLHINLCTIQTLIDLKEEFFIHNSVYIYIQCTY